MLIELYNYSTAQALNPKRISLYHEYENQVILLYHMNIFGNYIEFCKPYIHTTFFHILGKPKWEEAFVQMESHYIGKSVDI